MKSKMNTNKGIKWKSANKKWDRDEKDDSDTKKPGLTEKVINIWLKYVCS